MTLPKVHSLMIAVGCGLSGGYLAAAQDRAVFGEMPSGAAAPRNEILQPAELKPGMLEIIVPGKKSLPVAKGALQDMQEKLGTQKELYGDAKIMYDLPKKEGEVIGLENPRLPEVEKLRADLETKFPPQFVPLLADLKVKLDELDRESREKLAAQDADAGARIAEGFGRLQEQILDIYRRLPLSAINERTYLASNYAIAIKGEKSWHGRDDSHRPQIYETIHKRSRSCVGIFPRLGDRSGKPKGSGVVIGRNLVLTANHVIGDAEDAADEFDVVFNYEEERDPAIGVLRTVNTISRHRITKVVYSADRDDGRVDDHTARADFAILEFNPVNTQNESLIIGQVSLHAAASKRDTPIFLVGHPMSSPRIVHDNSLVKFPYLVNERELSELLCMVNAEFIDVGGGSAAEQADKLLKAYRKLDMGDGSFKFRYVARRDSDDIDAIGVESDTFKGDSGAPAMLRDTGEIIGILTRGEPPQEVIASSERLRVKPGGYQSGWRHHEVLLPIGVVIRIMKEFKPDWINAYDVRIIE